MRQIISNRFKKPVIIKTLRMSSFMFFTMTLPPFWLAAFLRVRKSLNPEDEMYSKAVQSRIMVLSASF